jgi:hypothetical protein
MIPKGSDPNGIIFEKKVPLGSVPFGTLLRDEGLFG